MKIAMICFSFTGQETAQRLSKGLQVKGAYVSVSHKSKYLTDSIQESVKQWSGRQFQEADGIIFVGACGIAVRSIAPFVAGKKTDPAVLVIDECARFVISLLSGHLGGANELAAAAAEILGAVPVVTTATDLHKQFAVDLFAKKNDCSIFHMKAAKETSAALLAGKPVGFYSEFPYEGELPEGLVLCDREGRPLLPQKEQGESGRVAGTAVSAQLPQGGCSRLCAGVAVTIHKTCFPFENTVHVVPAVLTLGIGCRRGKSAEQIHSASDGCLEQLSLYREAVERIASIGLKKDEAGIQSLSREWKVPFLTFSETELRDVRGEFTASAFVKNVTGVDNVCERSAVRASGEGCLIQKKKAADGVTTALAMRDWRIYFE